MNVVARCLRSAIPLLIAASLGAQKQQAVAMSAVPSLSPEGQLAYDELAPRFATVIEQVPGWYRDHPVQYYNFGEVRQPVTAGRVLWPVHGFDASGNPVAIRGQRPIFSAIPGVDGYSGV